MRWGRPKYRVNGPPYPTLCQSILFTSLFCTTANPARATRGTFSTPRSTADGSRCPPGPEAILRTLPGCRQVLIVWGSGAYAPNTSYEAAVWDPQAGTITTQPVGWDMFCNGMAVMPDGRPFVLDGTLQYDPFYGSPNTAAYDPNTGNFVELQGMAHGRWYPTVTTLGDGRMMVFSGLNETGRTNRALEIYTVGRRVEHAVHRALESAALPSHASAAEWHGVLFWPWANIQHLRSLHSDLDDERGHNQLRRHAYLWLLRPPTPDASVQLPASRDDPRRRQSGPASSSLQNPGSVTFSTVGT